MFYKLTSFLREKGLKHNTIAKTISILKVWLNQANELELSANTIHKNKLFSMPEMEVDNVALSEDEILKLWRYDFSDDTRLEKTRDLFIVGCFTGLRFSDFGRIKKEQFVKMDGELFLKIVTTKTKELVIIPVSPVITEIMKKYPDTANNLPSKISIQKFNEYIKEACKKAGMTELGRLANNATAPLYSLICSHTARRSFCTNMHQAGISDRVLMNISGHKSAKSFAKYLKVSKLYSAKKLSAYQKMNASKYLLSVAN